MIKKIMLYYVSTALSICLSIGCKDTGTKEKKALEQKAPKQTEYSTVVDFDRTVMQILDQSPQYNSFLKLVNSVSYFKEIENMNDVMVFVPTDEAFGPSLNEINELSEPENLKRLTEIIKYHFVQRNLNIENLISTIEIQDEPLRLQTMHGGYLATKLESGKLQLLDENTNTALIGNTCVKGSNGIVFTIDRILMPRKEVVID